MKNISVKIPDMLYETLVELKGEDSWKKFLDLEFIGYRIARIEKLESKLSNQKKLLYISIAVNICLILILLLNWV